MKKISFIKNQKGASAVEFAIILPVLVMLIFAIFEFGIAFNNYIALTHAAREGVRLAAVAEEEDYIKQEIIQRAPTVSIEEDNIDIIGLHDKVGMPVTVSVTGGVLNLDIPLVASKTLMLTSSATLRIEHEIEH
jgi:Flp pilus assembly protein TadG